MWCSEGEREWEDLELPVLWRLLSGISPWRLWHRAEKETSIICTCKTLYIFCVRTAGYGDNWKSLKIRGNDHFCVTYNQKYKETVRSNCVALSTLNFMLKCAHINQKFRHPTASLASSYLSKAAVLLPKSWQTAQWGDRGMTLTATDFSGGLTVDVIVVPIQVVVTSRAEQGTWWGQGARHCTSTVGVGGGLPERHWEDEETNSGYEETAAGRINRMRWRGNNCSSTHPKVTHMRLRLVTKGMNLHLI